MYYKIVNMCDWNCFKKSIVEGSVWKLNSFSKKYLESYGMLIDSLGEQISILDEFYGKERKAESDLGGVAYCFITYEDYEKYSDDIKTVHHIVECNLEYRDVISRIEEHEMIRELYIISNDFAIVMAYPRISK